MWIPPVKHIVHIKPAFSSDIKHPRWLQTEEDHRSDWMRLVSSYAVSWDKIYKGVNSDTETRTN